MAFLRVSAWVTLLMLGGCSGAASHVDGGAAPAKTAVPVYFSAENSPAGFRDAAEVALQATVSGPSAERTRSYGFSDRVATHVESGGPKCQRVDEYSHPDVFAALLCKLFETLKRDGVLANLAPGNAGSPLPPMVRIESSRGESLVREVTLRAAPHPRYVFGPGPNALQADYVLHLELQTSGAACVP